ncbi:MAG: hypothetical protein K0R82_1224 [Flavipsychrobacter sp.]|jgi:hypothetical protein|nr:hypothetical protein [Flavipsychrobacter sp.]
MTMPLRLLMSIVLICELSKCFAQSRVQTMGLVVDQDIFLDWVGLPNKDQNYTMGAGFFYADTKLPHTIALKPVRIITTKLYSLEGRTENAILQTGVTGFTPRYLGDNLCDSLYYIENDRPFASLLFFSMKHQLVEPRKVISNQIVVGVIGLHIAHAVQHHIHEHHWANSTREIPDGWKYQIANDGEPTILYSNKVDHLFEFSESKTAPGSPAIGQFILSREYRVGYYTGASVGAALRFGILDRERWASYDAYQMGYANKILGSSFANELYLIASLKPNFVLYNALLMGQFRPSPFKLTFGEINHVVVEGFLGVGGTAKFCHGQKALNCVLYLSGRTPEFDLPLKRSHYWGGVQLSYSCF